jgi:hypothetical protein
MKEEGVRAQASMYQDKQEQYQQKLQQSIKQKRVEDQKQKTVKTEKGKNTTDAVNKQDIQALLSVKDEVSLKSKKQFEWVKDKEGKAGLFVKPQKTFLSAVNLKTDGVTLLRMLGIKIDFSDRINQLKEHYMEYVVQARSPNYLLAKYGQFKLSFLGQLLSLMGVTQEEIRKMQKKALEGAIDENIVTFRENIYNQELLTIVQGGRMGRMGKDVLKEVEEQLQAQMRLLGREDYYTKARVLEVRCDQCTRILDEFKKEERNQEYQFDYIMQDGK